MRVSNFSPWGVSPMGKGCGGIFFVNGYGNLQATETCKLAKNLIELVFGSFGFG